MHRPLAEGNKFANETFSPHRRSGSPRVEDVDESDGHDEDEVAAADEEEGARHLGLAGLQPSTGLDAGKDGCRFASVFLTDDGKS